MTVVLDLQGVAKLYGRTAALKALTLRLEAGSVLALLGPNGSGKTTLLKIIAGALMPTLGDGVVCGHDLRRQRSGPRTDVGLLAAETYLYEDLTALENLRFILTMAGRRIPEEAFREALDTVGLSSNAGHRVRTFSSGMRRRLTLARLILLRPRLLLLDEPYNSLDEDAAGIVDDLVRRTVALEGAVVLATHDAARALALADRVAVLDRGAITFSGPSHGYAQYVG